MKLAGGLLRACLLGAVLIAGPGGASPVGPSRLAAPRTGSFPATRALAVAAFLGAPGSGASSDAPAAGSFVAPSGDDANPGTFEQPWRTLQHAADVASGAVWLRAGTYAGGVTVARSGITFAAVPGEDAIATATTEAPSRSSAHPT
jgi:hypothetical protein